MYPTTLDATVGGVASGAGVVPLGLTPDATLWGLPICLQHLVWDDVLYTGYGLPFGASPGLRLVIGS